MRTLANNAYIIQVEWKQLPPVPVLFGRTCPQQVIAMRVSVADNIALEYTALRDTTDTRPYATVSRG